VAAAVVAVVVEAAAAVGVDPLYPDIHQLQDQALGLQDMKMAEEEAEAAVVAAVAVAVVAAAVVAADIYHLAASGYHQGIL